MGRVAVDEEESEFPRGGQETLTALEKRLIKQQAQQDVLFGEVSLFSDIICLLSQTVNTMLYFM